MWALLSMAYWRHCDTLLFTWVRLSRGHSEYAQYTGAIGPWVVPTSDAVVMPLWPLTSEWATSPQPGTVVATGLCGDGKLVLSYDGGVRHFRYRNAVAMSWWRWQLATIATATRDDGGWRDVPTYCCYYY